MHQYFSYRCLLTWPSQQFLVTGPISSSSHEKCCTNINNGGRLHFSIKDKEFCLRYYVSIAGYILQKRMVSGRPLTFSGSSMNHPGTDSLLSLFKKNTFFENLSPHLKSLCGLQTRFLHQKLFATRANTNFMKILKITGIVIGVIIAALVLYYIKAYFKTERIINKTYSIVPIVLPIPADSSSLLTGKRLSVTKGCVECHGEDLGGKIINDDFLLGRVLAPNLTRGDGGIPKDFNAADWILALKHGIGRDNKALVFMPADEFALLSKSDMASLIGYCMQLPAVDRKLPETRLGPLARILADIGKLPLTAAEKVDHTKELKDDVIPGVTVDYGKYLSTSCKGCHKPTMKGGEAVAPGFPVVADITSTGNPGKWSTEQFIKTLRTGVTPEGKKLEPKYMPWPMANGFTDMELAALHLYLKSL
jgi:hypothetical protein